MTDNPLDDTITPNDPSVSAPPSENSEHESKPSPSRRNTRRASKLTPKDITRVISAYDRLRDVDDETLMVLASLTGADADAGALTTAMLSGKTASIDLIQSIMTWSEASEMDVTLDVYQLSERRAGLSPLWSLLHTLDALTPTNPPRNSVEATRAIVTAIRELGSSQITTLQRVVDIVE